MRFKATHTPFKSAFAGVKEEMAKGVTEDTRAVGEGLKEDWRNQIEAAFDNPAKLANTVRVRHYPSGGKTSLEPAALVWTKAPKLIDAYDRGVTIRAKGKKWLAIPTDAAGKRVARNGGPMRGGGRWEKVTPAGFERASGLKLQFVLDRASRGKTALLVVNQAQRSGRQGLARPYRVRGRGSKLYGPTGRSIVVFVLVAQVRVKKRLDLDALVSAAESRHAALSLRRWS